ncbi:unnamed protein product [Symbiodinium natans]|uniref:Uncharacterized protein n=1 Tax=Symbiodinium natans TaxID=878477 RepID=A0A812J4D8_9DINO|nr:unnamed protein product [Symbiodinium natans]
MLPHGCNPQWPAQMWSGFPLPHFYLGHTPHTPLTVPGRANQPCSGCPNNPEADHEPPPKRICLQRDRFDEDLYDRACALVDTMSPVEKGKLRIYLGSGVDSPDTVAPAPKEPEVCLHELFSQWVNVDTMDDDDAATVAETLCDAVAKVVKSDTLVVKLSTDLLAQAFRQTSSNCQPQIQQLLNIPCVLDEVVKAPAHLQPDAIARLPDHHPEKIKKWRELNKEMVRRVLSLQTSDTQKFWLREGVKPIAASSNERDVFFDMVRIVRLQCTKPEIKEFLAWFKSNVPAKFRKREPLTDKQAPLTQENGASTVHADIRTHAEQAVEPTTSCAERLKFDISQYNLERFAKDATSLEALTGEKATLVSVKDIGKTVKFDSNPELNQAISQFDNALESFGMSKPVRDEVYQHLKAATLSLGLRCNKTQVEDLRRWIARALALKYRSE